MRSHVCPASFLLSWLSFQILVYLAEAKLQNYEVNYGDDLGIATIEFNDSNHTAVITPPSDERPVTIINFKKGMMAYAFPEECLVTRFKDGENKYKSFIVNNTNPTTGLSTFYVGSSVSTNKLKKYLGKELFKWCDKKRSSRLTRRKPRVSNVINFADNPDGENGSQLTVDTEEYSHRIGYLRNKRSAMEGKKSQKSKDKKGKSKNNRGKGRKSKNKETKTPETKALRGRAQKLNVIAPRFEFPLANVPQLLTDGPAVQDSSSDHVILQEEPYLSPSFVRTDDDGQGFRHYRDFYQESSSNESGTHIPNHTNRIISLDSGSATDMQSKISIPETIVKDGQIFYRYDADENNSANDRGQSKRSHTTEHNVLDDNAPQPNEDFDYYDYNGGLSHDVPLQTHNKGDDPHQETSNGVHDIITDGNFNQHQGSAHAQVQAQMGGGRRGASAIALSDAGLGTHVLGNSDSNGFFLAQAHGMGHHGDGSLTHVFGNKHGMLGTAMTTGRQHQSHVQVDMGGHPSSTAHIATHGGTSMLSSSVQATQLSGNARSVAYGNGVSASNAQMEFKPSFHHNLENGGITGHGSASATVSNSGGTAFTSLSGKVAGGSYLGTAHSSIGTDHGLSSNDENSTSENHSEIGHSDEYRNRYGITDENVDEISHSDQLTGNTGAALKQEYNPHANQSVDHSHMIGDIMETVHQPDMQPDIILYPASEFNIIDDGGLTGGAGTPPRESDIERASGHAFRNVAEGASIPTGGSKSGIVGLATYSQGRVGAPPGPGELLSTPQYPSYQDYKYYDNEYGSEYYDEDYSNIRSQDPTEVPFFDLGPEIDFEPLESNYENFQPMLVPTQYPRERQESPEDLFTPLSELHGRDVLYSQEVTPDPPIIVHQVQAIPLLSDDESSEEVEESHTESQYPQRYATTQPYDSYFSTTPSPATESFQTAHVPSLEPEARTPQQQYYPDRHTTLPHDRNTLVQDSDTPSYAQRETYPHTGGVGFPSSYSDQKLRTRVSQQTQDSENFQIQTNEQSMISIPLHPGVPGSMHSLPGSHGGPDVNVMSLSVSGTKVDRSLLNQRPGTPIQPGEKIPGAPGYIVPPGFRGHVILGQNLPVSVDSRKVVQGFNTHVQLSPQNPPSNNPVFASVSGPGASQHLTPHTNNPSVHITLSGGDTNSQSMTHSPSTRSAISRTGQTHAAMRDQPHSSSSSGRSWSSRDNVLPTKSWDSMAERRTWESGNVLPTKSWDSIQQGRAPSQQSWRSGQSGTSGNRMSATGRKDSCKSYSMECKVVYGPYKSSKVCKPIVVTITCCC